MILITLYFRALSFSEGINKIQKNVMSLLNKKCFTNSILVLGEVFSLTRLASDLKLSILEY